MPQVGIELGQFRNTLIILDWLGCWLGVWFTAGKSKPEPEPEPEPVVLKLFQNLLNVGIEYNIEGLDYTDQEPRLILE